MYLQIAGVIFTAGITIGIGIALSRNKKSTGPSPDEIVADYQAIKTAFVQFKKQEKALVEDIKRLEEYMTEKRDIQWNRYAVSMDQSYLVVKNVKDIAKDVLDRVGGTSYIEGSKVYLSFMSVKNISKMRAEAKFKVIPPEGYLTTTNIEYDTSECKAEDNEIVEYEWGNNLARFSKPGIQTIRLRIQDKNGNWSDWFEEQIIVTEEKGVGSIEASVDTFYGLHRNGDVDGFGRNEFGQMGCGFVGTVESRQLLMHMENIKQLGAGEFHTVLLSYDRKVYSAGRNNYGQLGHGNRNDSKVPRQIWGMENMAQVGAGYNYSAALSVSGHVFTWGNNEHGQLGNEENYYREIPKRIESLTNIMHISCGATHMLALGYDGNVYSWGDNRSGQLGMGFKGKSNDPNMSEIGKIKAIAAGRGFSVAVTEGGRVLGWGTNSKGQLGIPGETEILFAQEIPYLKNIVEVKAFDSFCVAIDDIGQIYTWGTYRTLDDINYPKATKLDGLKYIKAIAAGNEHGYALKENGDLIRWSTDIDKHDTLILNTVAERPEEEMGGELNAAIGEQRRRR